MYSKKHFFFDIIHSPVYPLFTAAFIPSNLAADSRPFKFLTDRKLCFKQSRPISTAATRGSHDDITRSLTRLFQDGRAILKTVTKLFEILYVGHKTGPADIVQHLCGSLETRCTMIASNGIRKTYYTTCRKVTL